MTKNKITTSTESGYASVNGLSMYYEIHGKGRPLVLLHGSLMTIDTSFGNILPSLAMTQQVIAIEQQAHGHTADIDRPLTHEQMAEDTVELLRQLKIEKADFFGYSMGGEIALQIAIRYPDLVRKLVVASITFNSGGYHPGVLAGIAAMTPEALTGFPFEEAYTMTAPNPEDWPMLVAKVKQLYGQVQDWRPENIQAIKVPTLVMVGDSDIVRPEHAVEVFRLLGGGVPGDLAGLPRSQLAVLPGTTHATIVERADWLLSMVTEFLDAPIPEAR
jgi:pimeloyl-ACP methyl ester carboxylesterase